MISSCHLALLMRVNKRYNKTGFQQEARKVCQLPVTIKVKVRWMLRRLLTISKSALCNFMMTAEHA